MKTKKKIIKRRSGIAIAACKKTGAGYHNDKRNGRGGQKNKQTEFNDSLVNEYGEEDFLKEDIIRVSLSIEDRQLDWSLITELQNIGLCIYTIEHFDHSLINDLQSRGHHIYDMRHPLISGFILNDKLEQLKDINGVTFIETESVSLTNSSYCPESLGNCKGKSDENFD